MTCPIPFHVDTLCKSTNARTGRLELARRVVDTPVFMPVGTQGAIRTMPPDFLAETGAQIVLANTYHLHQRPGESLIKKVGGLHRFMGVDLPILTDSGGFQVFSLDKKSVTEEGVKFNYELDGQQVFLTPERSMQIQMALGSDIAMAFDECLPADADAMAVRSSLEMTTRWAERCLAAHDKPDQSLFGIVQGGMFAELRKRSVDQITSLPFDGFAVGGLSVGEGPEIMNEILAATMPHMPPGLPRYLMGVGRPQDLVDGVALGVDMFDCVIPTRHARGGALYTFQGRIRITNSSYRRDTYPIDTACGCYTCKRFSRAYVHHLFSIGEVLGTTLATIHNLRFFGDLMEKIREAIRAGTFASFRKDIKALYPEKAAAGAPGTKMDARKKMAAAAFGDVEPAVATPAKRPARGREAQARTGPAPTRPSRPGRAERGRGGPERTGPERAGPERSGREQATSERDAPATGRGKGRVKGKAPSKGKR